MWPAVHTYASSAALLFGRAAPKALRPTTLTSAHPRLMWALTASILLLAMAPSASAITISNRNSTQLFCANNFTSSASGANYYACPAYFSAPNNITSGYSGFSLGMTGAQGSIYHVLAQATMNFDVSVSDIPAAGGSIVAVLAIGPNLALATITAALQAGTINTIPEPSTSTLIVLTITFPALSSNATYNLATLDVFGNRVPTWNNTRVTRPGTGAVFLYSPPSPYLGNGTSYIWTSTFAPTSAFAASQWSTDPLGAIYITSAFANNVTIAGASTFTSSQFDGALPPPPPPLAALRTLPSAAAQLLLALAMSVVLCLCM